ncbi:MAG TPA: GTP 3',8-cyclase MoaA, partial [Chthoniobacterales bacterium]
YLDSTRPRPYRFAEMEDRYGHRISYLRVSITDRCNERCTYCMPRELQEWLAREDVLTYEETLRLIRIAAGLGVSKVRITGGEPLTRRDILGFMRQLPAIPGINDIGISTNGSLLSRGSSRPPAEAGSAAQASSRAWHEAEAPATMAQALRQAGVNSVNISLDTLDRDAYAETTGRDFLPQVLEGIDAAIAAKFPLIKLNCVLMRGRNDDQLIPLAEFAAARNLLLRFIELMPVSHSDVLDDSNFLPIAEARRNLESHFGALIPEPEFRTNGPSAYYKVAGREQRLGFIGAMTNLHFCESCNKLRLTCDGKLRPCLGSYLEFDIMKVMRAGATDADLRRFFLDVVERKPEQHDFRTTYLPGRMMVAIGG